MAEKTIGEVYATSTHGTPDAAERVLTEAADGSASYGRTLEELATSAAFTDVFIPVGDIDAVDVGFSPTVTLTSTNVQAALEELDTDVAGLVAAGSYSDEQARDAIGTALVAGEGIDITVNDGANTITIDAELASDTNPGVAEAATTAETNTGTDAARYVTPDGLAGSVFGTESVACEVFAAATALATGDGKFYFPIPTALNGMNLITCGATVLAKSTSGTPTVQIARGRKANATTAHSFSDMLSTRITIDANEFDSADAATAAVIDTSTDDVATGDLIRIDVDVAGTAATGLWVRMGFRLP